MNNFKDFWNNAEDQSALSSDSSSNSMALAAATQMSLGVASIVSSSIDVVSLFGENNQQQKIDKFSSEVTEYATSDEVISELSNKIGEPKRTETEDEFVERASAVLRGILRKKFKA